MSLVTRPAQPVEERALSNHSQDPYEFIKGLLALALVFMAGIVWLYIFKGVEYNV